MLWKIEEMLSLRELRTHSFVCGQIGEGSLKTTNLRFSISHSNLNEQYHELVGFDHLLHSLAV